MISYNGDEDGQLNDYSNFYLTKMMAVALTDIVTIRPFETVETSSITVRLKR